MIDSWCRLVGEDANTSRGWELWVGLLTPLWAGKRWSFLGAQVLEFTDRNASSTVF